MRSLLVTGGAGFIGANFVRLVAQQRPEVEITVLDKLTYAGNRANLAGVDATLVVGDVADEGIVDKLVAQADTCLLYTSDAADE